ncbi:MAG: DMT family transporter [Bacteroidetes bacterium]|nr:MAG: DMT family transporter [Bacteroidota bacterium]
MRPGKNAVAHLLLFTVALIYGANFTIAKVVLDGDYLQPAAFILLRVLSGVVLFSLFHRFFIREPVARRHLPLLLLCGIFGVAVNQLLFFEGLKRTSQINAALIMTTTPILVLLFSHFLKGEVFTWRKMFGVLLGAAGALWLITGGGRILYDSSANQGDLFVFLNASSYGLYLVLVKKLMRLYHPITVVKWVFAFGLVFVLPFGAPLMNSTPWSSFNTTIWLAIGYVLLFTTFLTYLLNALALKRVNPSLVGTYIYLQPLLATLVAVIWADAALHSDHLLAGGLIFSGVYFVSR